MHKFFKFGLAMITALSLHAEVIVMDTVDNDITGSCPAEDINNIIDFTTHTDLDIQGTFGDGWDADKYVFTPNVTGILKLGFNDSVNGNFKISFDDCVGGGNILRSVNKKVHPVKEIVIDEENLGKSINIGLWSSDNGGDYTLAIEFIPDVEQGGTTENNNTENNNTENNNTENNNTENNNTENNNTENNNTNENGDTTDNTELTFWENMEPYSGNIVAVTLDNNNSVVKLTGATNPDKNRASYTYKPNDDENFNGAENFIASWDMQAVTPYEIFFVSKSDDDPAITNYIGYVKETPQLEGYTFNQDTGYWSYNNQELKDWGRYTYKLLGDTSEQLTHITQNVKQDASDILGINLTSIEYMFINVYGSEENTMFIDNIKLISQDQPQVQNHAPIANDINITTNEDTNVNITFNGSDEDNDTITYEIVDHPQSGTLDGNTYTPNENFNGTDSFTYKANDGTEDSTVATVTITINPVNDAPIATDLNITVDQNNSVEIEFIATDVDGDDLNYSIVQQPQHGTLDGNTYKPNEDFNGTDSFTYKANDGTEDSEEATVTITVNRVDNNSTQEENIVQYNEQNDRENITCPGELLDDLNGIDSNKTLEITGKLNANWDIDIYSFIPKDKNAKLEITLIDANGNNINFYIVSNCTIPLQNSNGKYTIPNKCGIISIVVGCDHEYTEDMEYKLTIKYIK